MTWREETIIITTKEGEQKAINGWRDRENGPLAVTPEWNADAPLSTKCVITHVRTGLTLWPNAWPLELAQRICAALLELPDWEKPNPLANADFTARAERIVKSIGFGQAPTSQRKDPSRIIARFHQ
jgi:hypothetical protein